jgi:hypothetical protein
MIYGNYKDVGNHCSPKGKGVKKWTLCVMQKLMIYVLSHSLEEPHDMPLVLW